MVARVRKIIEDGHLGVRTFETFAQACLEEAKTNDEDAVALFVFAALVQPFADYYFDQALDQQTAVEFRDKIHAILNRYEAAGSIEAKMEALRTAIRAELRSH